MSNLLNNRINVTVTPAQLTAVKEAFQIIQTNLPFLTGLTPEERKILTSIDSSNRAFTEEAISAGLNNAPFVPTYVSMTDIQTDMMLFRQLDEISIIAQ